MTHDTHHPLPATWEEQLRSQFSSHEAEPPADLWEGIERGLAVCEGAKSEKGGVVPLRIRWASTAAAIALTAGAALWMFAPRDTESPKPAPILAKTGAETPLSAPENTVFPPNMVTPAANSAGTARTNAQNVATDTSAAASDNSDGEASSSDHVGNPSEYMANLSDLAAEHPDMVANQSDLAANQSNETPHQSVSTEESTPRDDDRYYVHDTHSPYIDEPHRRAVRRRLQLAFHAGQGLDGLDAFSDSDSDMGAIDPGDDTDTPDDKTESPHKSKAYMGYSDHEYPIKAAALVRLPLTRRLALDAGLSYTFLRSSLHAAYYITSRQWGGEQRVHYLGVPLALSYSLYDSRRWSIYLSAGGEVAKAVSVDWRWDNDWQLAPPAHPWQLSVSASAGVQYNLSRRVGIYVQPSADYYFDNHSSVATYYSDHPFTPSLQVGVRFNVN